jgi:hypothetical protein
MSKKWGIEKHEKIIAESNRCIELLRNFEIGAYYKLKLNAGVSNISVVVEVRDMHSNQINVNVLAAEQDGLISHGRNNKKKGTYASQIELEYILDLELLNKGMAPLMVNYDFMSAEIKTLMFKS